MHWSAFGHIVPPVVKNFALFLSGRKMSAIMPHWVVRSSSQQERRLRESAGPWTQTWGPYSFWTSGNSVDHVWGVFLHHPCQHHHLAHPVADTEHPHGGSVGLTLFRLSFVLFSMYMPLSPESATWDGQCLSWDVNEPVPALWVSFQG